MPPFPSHRFLSRSAPSDPIPPPPGSLFIPPTDLRACPPLAVAVSTHPGGAVLLARACRPLPPSPAEPSRDFGPGRGTRRRCGRRGLGTFLLKGVPHHCVWPGASLRHRTHRAAPLAQKENELIIREGRDFNLMLIARRRHIPRREDHCSSKLSRPSPSQCHRSSRKSVAEALPRRRPGPCAADQDAPPP